MLVLEDFFTLQNFAHDSLWQNQEVVWDALFHIKNYMRDFRYKIKIEIFSGVYIQNRDFVFIDEGTRIDPGVLIQGPCIIGKNCVIRHGAFLREGSILGDGCSIGHGSELKNAVLLDGATVAHLCYVGDSILGRGVNLGAGVKCSNLRLDRREISVNVEGKRLFTGLKKLGAVIGSNVQIGCNAVLNPGTFIGKNSFVHPLLNVGGFILKDSEVKAVQSIRVEPIVNLV